MKFISKHSNYRVVLRPGIPGNRMNGTQTIPGIYIKFEGGMVDVKNEEHIKMMLEHPAFINGSFIVAPEDKKDPYLASRKNIEPEHNISEMVHGSVGKTLTPKPTVKISEEQKKIMIESAKKMATVMFLEMKKKDEENKVVQEETQAEEVKEPIAEQTFEPIKHSNLTAPEPIEDESPVVSNQEGSSSPVQVERVESDKVKVELEEDDGSILKAKHAPDTSTATPPTTTPPIATLSTATPQRGRGRPRKTDEQSNK